MIIGTWYKAVTKGVTWGVTKAVTCAAAPVEQLACRQLRFGLELRPPVTERLQRQALRLTILPLIQVTPLPRFMMRPPECLLVSRPIRKMGISEKTFYRWKKLYAAMGVAELRRLKQLEEENRKLKQLVADLSLDKIMLQDVIRS